MAGFLLIAQPFVICLPFAFGIFYDGVSVLNTDGVIEPTNRFGASPEIAELPVTFQIDSAPYNVIMDAGFPAFVNMRLYD